MVWKLKRTIFGYAFDVDIETRPYVIQELYDLKLKKIWTGNEHADLKRSHSFISKALSWLPGEHFIIFFFDPSDDYFVQFLNLGGNVILNFPMWPGNPSFGKADEVIQLLRSMGFKRRYLKSGKSKPYVFYDFSHSKDKKEIQVEFGDDYKCAANVALQLVDRVYGMARIGVFHYHSDQLVSTE